MAAEAKANDPQLKTQIRWGLKDIKMFTKKKGTQEVFKKVSLKDFMGAQSLPDFDETIKWKTRREVKQSKKLDFTRRRPELPSLRKDSTEQPADSQKKPGIYRQLSNTNRGEKAKFLKLQIL